MTTAATQATEQVTEQRHACDGSCFQGRYATGPVINGVPRLHGVCFRCQGKGYQTDADVKRNTYYDNRVRKFRI
jgi:hypothetical protein